jgi:hypothetical protein
MKYVPVVIISASPKHYPGTISISNGFPSFSKLRQTPSASGPVFLSID